MLVSVTNCSPPRIALVCAATNRHLFPSRPVGIRSLYSSSRQPILCYFSVFLLLMGLVFMLWGERERMCACVCLLHALSFGISGVLVALLCRAHYAFSPVCFAWASKASLLGIDIKVQSPSDAKFKSFPFVLETILKVEFQSLWTHRMGARGKCESLFLFGLGVCVAPDQDDHCFCLLLPSENGSCSAGPVQCGLPWPVITSGTLSWQTPSGISPSS